MRQQEEIRQRLEQLLRDKTAMGYVELSSAALRIAECAHQYGLKLEIDNTLPPRGRS